MNFTRLFERQISVFKLSLLVLALLAPSQAIAASQTNRLIYLPSKDLEIRYVGAKDQWCAPRLDLVLITSQPLILQDKKLVRLQMVQLISKLRINCPAIMKVGIVGFSHDEPNRPLLEGSYRAKDAWKFSKIKLAARFTPPSAQPTSPTNNVNTSNRQLNPQEAVELQKRLAFLGFNVGKIDGNLERQTATAISNFLTKYNLSLPARPDLKMLLAVRNISKGNPSAKSPVTRRGGLASYLDTGNIRTVNLDRVFALKTVQNSPFMLENQTIVLRWLKAEAKDNRSPIQARSVALLRFYNKGTQFQKKDTLKAFRQLIESEIQHRETELRQPLAMMIRFQNPRISGRHEAGKGFSFSYRSSRGFGFNRDTRPANNEITYNIRRLGRVLRLPMNRQTSANFIPIIEESKARVLAKLLQNTRRYVFEMRYYVIIKNLGFLTNGGHLLQAETVVDRFSSEMIDNNFPSRGTQLVYNWNLAVSQDSSGPEPKIANSDPNSLALAFAQELRIKILRGNLVLDSWNRSGRVDFTAVREKKQSLTKIQKFGWAGWANLLALQRDPSLLNYKEIAYAVANTYLDPVEKAELTRGRNFLTTANRSRDYWNFNEFDLREFEARFEQGAYASRVGRIFPPFPLPIVDIRAVYLGNFNFETGSFPIQFDEGRKGRKDKNVATWTPTLNLNMHEAFNLQRYPRILPFSPEYARQLLSRFESSNNQRRKVYLAIYATMQEVSSKRSVGRYNVVANRVAIYLEPNLQTLLADFSIEQLTKPEKRRTLAALSISQSKLDALYNKIVVNQDELARVVERLSLRKGFSGTYVRSMRAVKDANELEKERVFKKFAEILRFVKEPPSYWMKGWATLGRYDLKRSGFPIVDWQLNSTSSKISGTSSRFRTEFENVEIAAFVRMERDRAEELLERYPSRRFLFRAKVTPSKATWRFREDENEDAREARYAEGTISAQINEIYLLGDPSTDQKGERTLIVRKVIEQ